MNKTKLFVRIMCWILAGLMLSGAITTIAMFLR